MDHLTIGIVSAPELPANIVYRLQDQLEEALHDEFPDVAWHVEVEIDRLTGAVDTTKEIMEETKRMQERNNWNYAISFTDLPVFHGKYVVLADADTRKNIAQISLPAFGITPTIKRVKAMFLHLLKELYVKSDQMKQDEEVTNYSTVKNNLHIHASLKKFRLAKVRRVEVAKKQDGMFIRFLMKPLFGKLPLILSGMTIANQPWAIMPSFKKVVGLAFATGSYMLVFTTLWKLSYLYDPVRFILLMCFAIGGMTAWTIFAHNLWEKKETSNQSTIRFIYNASTVLTLLTSIIIFYIGLFCLFLFAVIIFVPPDMFQEVIDEEISMINYFALVWLVTSAATVAGAIGAGLENEEFVKKSTYGYRQYSRLKEIQRQEEADDKMNEKK